MAKAADQLVVPPIPVIDGAPVMHFTTAQVCSALNCSPAALRALLRRARSHPAAIALNGAATPRGAKKRTYFYAAVYRAADLLGGAPWPARANEPKARAV